MPKISDLTAATSVGTGDTVPIVQSGTTKRATVSQISDAQFEIAAIPRCTAGTFSLLSDSGHAPLNVSSVSEPDAFTVRVNYSRTASKVQSFVVGADDALAPYGVIAGGDVGTAYANVLSFAPFSGYVSGASSPSLTLNSLWSPGIAGGSISVSKVDASLVRILHTEAVTSDPVVVTLVSSSLARFPCVSFSASQIDITMLGDAQGYVSYSGSAWSQALSDNVTAPTLSWTGDNTLRVDHGVSSSTNRTPLVTPHGGSYVPQIENIGTTYFDVGFYDYAGSKVTTQGTGMKFWYRRDLPVASTWPDATIVAFRRGHCKVPIANFSNVSGNNLWVIGRMLP